MVLRSAGRVDGLECPDEGGEVERGLDRIVEPIEGRQLARQPSHDTPRVRKLLLRLAGRNR
jgi:hypothetical protein